MPFEPLRPPCVQLEASCGYKSANTLFQVSKHSEPYSRANEWTMYSRFCNYVLIKVMLINMNEWELGISFHFKIEIEIN